MINNRILQGGCGFFMVFAYFCYPLKLKFMYEFIQKFHSGWAYIVLALLVFTAINAVMGLSSGRDFSARDRKIGLFTLIASHVQLLVGLVLYFISPLGKALLGDMSNAEARLTSLEHPLTNIIAIVLITVGWSTHKKATESGVKFKKFAIFYTLGLVLILSRIPWKLWL